MTFKYLKVVLLSQCFMNPAEVEISSTGESFAILSLVSAETKHHA